MQKTNKQNLEKDVNRDQEGFRENRRGFLETEGMVEELYPNTNFKVKLKTGQEIFAHLSGKMRMNKIKILPGDQVTLEISHYDLTKGRIIKRI